MSWNDYIYYTTTITASWILLHYNKHSTHYTMLQQLQTFYILKKAITSILHSKKKQLQIFYTLYYRNYKHSTH